MARIFGAAATNSINFGSAASLDDLSTWTQIFWICPTTLTAFRYLMDKAVVSGGRRTIFTPGNDVTQIRAEVNRADDNSAYRRTNNAGIANNVWRYIAVTCDISDATALHVYVGGLSTEAFECTYDDTAEGSGVLRADAAADFIIGNKYLLDSPFIGRIAFCGHWNTTFTLAQIQEQQFHPHVTAGCVLFSWLGWGTSDADLSGNLNLGTVTGTTLGDNVPLSPPFGFSDYESYAIAGGTSTPKSFSGTMALTDIAGVLVKQGQKPLAGGLAPGGTLTKVLSLIRSYAGGITPTGVLTNIKAVTKAFAGGLTPSGTLANLKAIVRMFAGSITPIGPGTYSWVVEKTLTGGLTPGGTTGVLGTIKAIVSDSITVTENVLVSIAAISVNVSENISHTEAVTTTAIRQINKTENITVTDILYQVIIPTGTLYVEVSDHVTITDTPTVTPTQVNVTDNIAVTESISLSIPISISVEQKLNIEDSIAKYTPILEVSTSDVSVSDNIIIDDPCRASVPVEFEINVSDTITIGGMAMYHVWADVSDPQITVKDDITVTESTAPSTTPNVTTTQNVTISEAITLSLPDVLLIDVHDHVTITESNPLALGTIRVVVYDIVTVDTSTCSAYVDVPFLGYAVRASDNITITESGFTLIYGGSKGTETSRIYDVTEEYRQLDVEEEDRVLEV